LSDHSEGEDNSEEIITEEMLWEKIPEVEGLDRANTYYELSARIYARGQYDEALALAETARDIYADLGAIAPAEGLAQAYSAIGYNLNQLKRMNEAATAMSKAVELLRETKSPMAIELACTLGEWWYGSKEYEKTIECMNQCVQEHLVDGNDSGAANDLHLIGCAARCDQKIAHCLTELGDAEGALIAAQKSLDVFVTAHDHRRETYSSFELGKAQLAAGYYEEALMTLENVLESVTEAEYKDFEFIIDIERKIALSLTKLERVDEANEIIRRLDAVTEVIDEN